MSDASDIHNRGGFTAFIFAMAFVLLLFYLPRCRPPRC